jgi:hypothetical protein
VGQLDGLRVGRARAEPRSARLPRPADDGAGRTREPPRPPRRGATMGGALSAHRGSHAGALLGRRTLRRPPYRQRRARRLRQPADAHASRPRGRPSSGGLRGDDEATRRGRLSDASWRGDRTGGEPPLRLGRVLARTHLGPLDDAARRRAAPRGTPGSRRRPRAAVHPHLHARGDGRELRRALRRRPARSEHDLDGLGVPDAAAAREGSPEAAAA